MLVSDNKFFYFFLSILPISIVAGPSVSLANILLIVFLYFYIFFKYKHYVFIFENNTIRLLIVIYIYLIFNSFISIDFESGLNRNIGFIRLSMYDNKQQQEEIDSLNNKLNDIKLILE